MAVLTEEERKDLYSKLLAKKQGRSETEKASIAGGILQGITDIAQAGTGVNTDVRSNLQRVGEARDKAKASKADEYRKLLKLDREQRLDDITQANKEKDFGFKERELDIREGAQAADQGLKDKQLGIAQGNLDVRRMEAENAAGKLARRQAQADKLNEYLRKKLGKDYVEGAPQELNKELLEQQQKDEAALVDRVEQATKLSEDMTLTDEGKPMSDQQSKAQGLLSTAEAAVQNMEALENSEQMDNVTDRAQKYRFITNMTERLEEIPVVGGALGVLTSPIEEVVGAATLDTPTKDYLTEVRAFIGAKLRRESGASISATEFQKEYEKFFPMPNDVPETIKKKQELRRRELEKLKIESGNSRQRLFFEDDA